MSKPQEKYRKILLSEEINAGSVKTIIEKIMEINADDDIKDFVKTYSIRNQASRFDYETSRTSWNPPKEAKNAFLITLGVWR